MNDLKEKKNMSDVEQEYLRMVDEETPDLWNRIEAGLNENNYPADQGFFEPQEVKEVKKRPKYGLIISGIAVAAAVLFISIFALTGGFGRKKNESSKGEQTYKPNFAFDSENAGMNDSVAADSTNDDKKKATIKPEPAQEAADEGAEDDHDSGQKRDAQEQIAGEKATEAESQMDEPAISAETNTEAQREESVNPTLNGGSGKENYIINEMVDELDNDSLNTNRANADTGKGTAKVLKVGDAAPDFTIELLGGGTFHMADYDDQIVVLDFWATWCGTCVAGLPVIARLENEGLEGVKVLSVDLGDPESEVEWTLKEGGFSLTVGLDSQGKVSNYYPSVYIPYTLVIDHGVVAAIVDVYDPDELYPALKKAIEDCRK